MKIRPKLILAEAIVSLTLFLAIVISIHFLVRFIQFEEFKVRAVKLENTVNQAKYSVVNMLSSSEATYSLIYSYDVYNAQVSQSMASITEDPLFKELPGKVHSLFVIIDNGLENLQTSFNSKNINNYLNLRYNSEDNENLESLIYIQATLKELGTGSDDYIEELDDAVSKITSQILAFTKFEQLIHQTLTSMLQEAKDLKRKLMLIAISVPASILFFVIIGMTLFTNTLSKKIIRLNESLNDIVGGDFSVRIDTKGQDEFSSLAESLNTFTKTLGSKMESFRLLMHDIGQTLANSLDSTQVEETLLKLTLQETVADGAALYKVGKDTGELILSTSTEKFRPPFTVADLPDSPDEEDINAILRSRIIAPGETILGESAVRGKAILIKDVAHDSKFDWSRKSTDVMYISSIIVVPLRIGSTVFGVIAITSTQPGTMFNDLEFANMQSFSELAAMTLDNVYKYSDLLDATQLNRELEVAEEIQKNLLSRRLPGIDNGEVKILSRSLTGLNGDYYEVLSLGEGKTLVTICEVAGRGIPAGLVMVIMHTILTLVSSPDHDAKTTMTMLNRDIIGQIAIESYASVGIMIIDSKGHFTFSSAAHYPLQILRSETNLFEEVQTEGIPVGINKNAQYKQHSGMLHANDLVIFHTDGVPESRNRNGEILGIKNMLKMIKSEAENSLDTIVENLGTELEFFEKGTKLQDDQTIIVLKYTGRSAV